MGLLMEQIPPTGHIKFLDLRHNKIEAEDERASPPLQGRFSPHSAQQIKILKNLFSRRIPFKI